MSHENITGTRVTAFLQRVHPSIAPRVEAPLAASCDRMSANEAGASGEQCCSYLQAAVDREGITLGL